MSMRLLGSLTSPYVRKVRVVLAEKGLACEFVTENVWGANAQINRFNPLGKVPCLILDDGRSLVDSRVIAAYLDTLAPEPLLIPPAQRTDVLRWEALADGLLDAAILARLEQTWSGRSEAERSQAWVQRQLGKVEATLAVLSADLQGKTWCVGGDAPTLADVAVGCALAYLDLRFPDLHWRERHAPLAGLLDQRLAVRASFVQTQPPRGE